MSVLRLTILTIVIATLLFVVLSSRGYDPVYPTNGSAIVVFGDSLAHGHGANTGNDIASLLSERFGQPVINLGVDGDTTSAALARIDDVFEHDPRVVVVLLGGNDALKRVAVETTFGNLTEIINRIHDYGAAVVLVAEPGGLSGPRYVKEYEQLTQKHRTFFVSNILHNIIGHPNLMSDAIHPNDIGYMRMADRIEPEVRRALMGP